MPALLPPRFTSMDSERHQPTIRRTHADRRAPVAQCSRLGESEEFRSWARLSFTCRTLCHIVLRPPHRRRAKNGTPRTKHTVDRGADGTAGAVVPRRPSDRIRGKYHTLSPVCPTPSNFPRLPLRFNFGSNSRREDGFCYSLLDWIYPLKNEEQNVCWGKGLSGCLIMVIAAGSKPCPLQRLSNQSIFHRTPSALAKLPDSVAALLSQSSTAPPA